MRGARPASAGDRRGDIPAAPATGAPVLRTAPVTGSIHSSFLIVAIDGPAGSGKSTTARAVARRLGYMYLDTGAMYRVVALAFLRDGAEPTPEEARRVLPEMRVDVRSADEGQRVFLDGEDVTEKIRSAEVTRMSSAVAALPEVRRKLVDEQRRIARTYAGDEGGVVLDGRDIGTVVFPDADVKIFMIADERVRAQRRFDEMRAKGTETTLEEVLGDIRARDRKDAGRSTAPLRKADDAVELDTSQLNVDEQVNVVLQAVKERQNLSAV